jgi:hypothetical protein
MDRRCTHAARGGRRDEAADGGGVGWTTTIAGTSSHDVSRVLAAISDLRCRNSQISTHTIATMRPEITTIATMTRHSSAQMVDVFASSDVGTPTGSKTVSSATDRTSSDSTELVAAR